MPAQRFRVARIGLVILTTIALTTALPAITPTATADVNNTIGTEPRPGINQTPEAHSPALAWGIRGSFYRYVSGATHILDGAKKGQGDYFLWPYQSTTRNGDTLSIQYGGTVNFMKYCAGNQVKRGNCDLDFTFADPRIEFDTATGRGHIYATVHTKSYPDGVWSGPETVQVGVIDTNAGRYNNANDITTWTGVSAKLTAAGNHAFSDFYEEGGFLDSLNFSYPFAGEIKETQEGYNLRHRLSTDTEFNGGSNLYTRGDGNVVMVNGVQGKSGAVRVFDSNLSTAPAATEIQISAKGASGYDTTTDTLYWLHKQDVYAAKTTASGIETPVKIATIPGTTVYGFAFSQATKEIGIISNTPGGTANRDYQFISIPVSGTSAGTPTTVALPTPKQLYPELNSEVDDSVYGTSLFADSYAFRALPDGTFLAVHGHLLDVAGEVRGNVPIHITPKAATTAVPLLQFSDEFTKVRSYRGMFTDGNNRIGIWSQLGGSPVLELTYDAATKTFSKGYSTSGLAEATEIAGAAFTPDGDIAVVSQDRSQVVFVDTKTGTVKATAALSQHMKDTRQNFNQGIVFNKEGSLFVIDRPTDPNYEEFVGIQLLTLPSSDGRVDSGIKPFTMADSNRPDLNRENNDTEAPKVPEKPEEPKKPESTPSSGSSTSSENSNPLARLLSALGQVGRVLASPFMLLLNLFK